MLYLNKLKLHEKFRSIILFSALAHVLNLKNKKKKSPKKIHPEKKFLYFKNRNFLALILTEILIFSYISKNGCLHYLTSSLKKQKKSIPKKVPLLQKMKLSSSNIKKFLYFQIWHLTLSGLRPQNFSLKKLL